MIIKIVGLTSVGGREKNDDRIMLDKSVYENGKHELVVSMPCGIAICDGVGGYKEGDKAAELVLTRLAESNLFQIMNEGQLAVRLEEINQELFKRQKHCHIDEGMRTTIVGINFYRDRVVYYNSGDSRLYRYRDNILRKLSEDHSVAQEMIDKGIITGDYEKKLMNCNCITRCLGVKNSLPPYIRQINHVAMINDIYLLCSDGLWGAVLDKKIEETLKLKITLENKVSILYELAQNNHSQDNISIIAAEIFE